MVSSALLSAMPLTGSCRGGRITALSGAAARPSAVHSNLQYEQSGVFFLSTPQSQVRPQSCPVIHGSPIASDGPRMPLHSPEFAADPHHAYSEMRRQYGSLAPV